nr:zinc finger, C2H2 [Tanacetum cinerariifolium]
MTTLNAFLGKRLRRNNKVTPPQNAVVEDDDKKAKGVVVERVCEPAPLVVEDGMEWVDNDLIFNGLAIVDAT